MHSTVAGTLVCRSGGAHLVGEGLWDVELGLVQGFQDLFEGAVLLQELVGALGAYPANRAAVVAPAQDAHIDELVLEAADTQVSLQIALHSQCSAVQHC